MAVDRSPSEIDTRYTGAVVRFLHWNNHREYSWDAGDFSLEEKRATSPVGVCVVALLYVTKWTDSSVESQTHYLPTPDSPGASP